MVKKALPKKKVQKALPRRRVLMYGSRYELKNLPEKIEIKFKEMHKADPHFMVIVGKALGVDTICEYYAKKYKHKIMPFPAKWQDENGRYDPTAGFNRNSIMVEKCTEAIGFWNGKSTGSQDTTKKLKASGKPYEIIKPD